MKKFIAAVALSVTTMFAAELDLPNNEAELIEMSDIAQKKALVLATMQLRGSEKETFGKLYDEYQTALMDLNVQYAELINDFAKDYGSMNNQKASQILKQWKTLEKKAIDMEVDYIVKFEKKLPSTVVLRYFQIENKIAAIQEAQLTSVIPLANESSVK